MGVVERGGERRGEVESEEERWGVGERGRRGDRSACTFDLSNVSRNWFRPYSLAIHSRKLHFWSTCNFISISPNAPGPSEYNMYMHDTAYTQEKDVRKIQRYSLAGMLKALEYIWRRRIFRIYGILVLYKWGQRNNSSCRPVCRCLIIYKTSCHFRDDIVFT